MGNVSDNRSNLLAKNWTQVGPNMFKNLITEELIDCHEVPIHSDQELSFNNNMLMKRASLSHPNVLKLIYFCPYETGTLCSTAKHKIKIYLQHQQSTLADRISKQKGFQPVSPTNGNTNPCMCTSLASGIAYLAERYGFFQIQDSMVWIAGEWGFKVSHKMIPKVWIHSDLKSSQPQSICNEQKMCRLLTEILKSIADNNLCQIAMQMKQFPLISKLSQLIQAVYDVHNQSAPLLPRKRIQTVYSTKQGQPNLQPYIVNRSQFLKPNEDNSIGFQAQRQQKQAMKQLLDQSLLQPSRRDDLRVLNKNGSNPFSKVNFIFNQTSVTPKQRKDQYQGNQQGSISSKQLSNSKSQSPMQNIQHLTSSNRAGKSQVNTTQSIISRFNPNFRPQESDLIISEEQADSKLKQLMETERNPSDSTKITNQEPLNPKIQIKKTQSIRQISKESSKDYQNSTANQQITSPNRADSTNFSRKARQLNLKMEHNLEVSYEHSSRVSIKSIGSKNTQKANNFEIVSQYRISVGPKPLLDELQLENSEEYLGSQSEVTDRQKSVFSQQNLKSQNQRIMLSSGDRNKFFISSHQAKSGKNEKKECQYQGAEYNRYLKRFKEVTLSESKLQYPKVLQSERHHFGDESSGKVSFKHHYLTSSNEVKDIKYQGVGSQRYLKRPAETVGMLEHDRRLQQQIQSLYDQASEEQRRKANIMVKITNTQQVLRENRKKLQRLQLEKDLQIQKSIIKKQMESLLINNLMVDQSHRIKEKVEHKKATFAQLKAQASKILEDLNF